MFFTPEQVVSSNKTFPILSIALKPGRRRSGYRNVVAVTEGRIRFDQITIQFTAMAILLFAVRPQKKDDDVTDADAGDQINWRGR